MPIGSPPRILLDAFDKRLAKLGAVIAGDNHVYPCWPRLACRRSQLECWRGTTEVDIEVKSFWALLRANRRRLFPFLIGNPGQNLSDWAVSAHGRTRDW